MKKVKEEIKELNDEIKEEIEEQFNEETAIKELKSGYVKAEKLLKDNEKLERFLQRLEKKLKVIPIAGNTLAIVPTMISLVRMYVKKEYTDIPLGTIIAIISALIYVLSPVDLIPDAIPGGIGHMDDVGIVGVCLKLVGSDIEDYQKWRKENNKILDV